MITRIQRLFDGLIFVEKGFGVHVQHMYELSRVYTLTEIISKMFGKDRRKIGDLIYNHDLTNKEFGANSFFYQNIYFAITACMPLSLHSENID